MKITILKARRITSSIDRLLKDLLPISRDRFSYRDKSESGHFIYADVDSASAIGDNNVAKIVNDYEELLAVKYHLRSLVGVFNSSSNINALQNESKEKESINQGLNAVLNKYKIPSFNTTNNQFSDGCSDVFLRNIKKRIQKNNNDIQNISDKCAEINLTNKIEISDDFVTILKNYDLLG